MKNIMRILSFMFGILLVGMISGCSTIFFGTSQKIKIDSEPSGVHVYAAGRYRGNTPLVLRVPRNREFLDIVLVPTDADLGFAPTRVDLENSFGSMRFLCTSIMNICSFYGIPGLFADLRTDANYYYEASDIVVPLLLPEEEQLSLYGGNVLLTNVSKEKRN